MEQAIETLARAVVILASTSLACVGLLVLARERGEVRPAPLERAGGAVGLVNFVGIGAFVFVGLGSALSLAGTIRPPAGSHDDAVRLVGIGVLWAAGLLAACGLRAMGRQLVSAAEVRPDTRLVTSGPFRLVRHPLYLSVLLLWAGGALALLSWVMALCLVLLWPLFVVRARQEEVLLERHFGAAYREYAERVPMLLPGRPPGPGRPSRPVRRG